MFFFTLLLLIANIAVIIKIYCKLTCGICKCSRHLVGKVIIITGANTGIGYETAKDLAERGGKVILACRNQLKGIAAQNSIIALTGNTSVYYEHLDLSSFNSVVTFANNITKKEKRLDILINNAGIFNAVNSKSTDGLPLIMQTNYFGPFLLIYLLQHLLKASVPSRIINVASSDYISGEIDFYNLNNDNASFSQQQLYKNSKMCNVIMTLELARRLQGTGVTANCLHPGYVATESLMNGRKIWTRYFMMLLKPFLKTPREGAQTAIHMAISPKMENVSGNYMIDCKKANIASLVQDVQMARKLWALSEEVVGLKYILKID